jgi:small multidrug resistance pump
MTTAGASVGDAAARRRRRVAWALLVVAIVSGALGTSTLPATNGFTDLRAVAVMAACYGLCFLALTRALVEIPVPIAYALWSGLGIVLVSAIGWLVHEQPLNAGELIGIGLILAGVVVIQLGSRSIR